MSSFRIQVFALIAIAITSRSLFASENQKLQIIISNIAETEVLIVAQEGQFVEWKLVTKGLGEARGRAIASFSSIKEGFEAVVKMQDLDSQLQRMDNALRASRHNPTFTLMLSTDVYQVSRPLTDQQRKTFVKLKSMQSIFASMGSERALRKPQLVLRFFDLNPAGGQSNPNAHKLSPLSSEDDSPWEDDDPR